MITEFTVDRAMWGTKELRNSFTGKMCCLGFLAKECGYADWRLDGEGYPHNDWENIPESLRAMSPLGDLTTIMELIVTINDNTKYSLPEKESKLVDAFSRVGIKINFTGNPDDYKP